MATGADLIGAWLDSYGSFAENGLKRIAKARRDLLDAEYKPQQLFSDLFYFWVDAPIRLWTSPFRGAGTSAPVVFLKIQPDAEADARPVRVDAPGETEPECTELIPLHAGGQPLPKDKVKLELNEQRTELKVWLQGLAADDVDLQHGHQYLGCAYVDKTFLAYIHVIVVDPKK